MTRIAVLAFGTAIIFSAASAQALYCHKPGEPSIPLSGTTDHYRMERAQEDVQEYFEKIGAYIECLQGEIASTIREAEDVGSEWEDAVEDYNRS